MKKILSTAFFILLSTFVMSQDFYDLLKSDVGMKRRSLVKKHLQMDAAEADKFWPIFEDYSEEISDFYDGKRKEYQSALENFNNMNESKALEIGEEFFKFNEERLALKKKYFERMKAELSPTTVIKFFQIDYQIDLLIDVQIAGEVPLVDDGF
jgi:hypothetical protein